MAQIRVENLRKSFDQFTAVHELELHDRKRDLLCLARPFRLRQDDDAAHDRRSRASTSGRILLDGEDVTFRRAAARDIAFVFQLFALYPHMNVSRTSAFRSNARACRAARSASGCGETARLLRIEHLLASKTSNLSGGDRQRVALGRAIVRRPKAFLMDEPLGALDAEFRHLMCGELRDLHDRISATTIYVTHDQLEAMSMADHIVVMKTAKIEQIGSPQEIYDRPANMFVADFIGSPPMNFLQLRGRLQSGDRAVSLARRRDCRPELREQRDRGRRWSWAFGPSTSFLPRTAPVRGRVFGAEYLGTTQIVTLDDRARAHQGAAARRASVEGRRDASASAFRPATAGVVRRGDAARAHTRRQPTGAR